MSDNTNRFSTGRKAFGWVFWGVVLPAVFFTARELLTMRPLYSGSLFRDSLLVTVPALAVFLYAAYTRLENLPWGISVLPQVILAALGLFILGGAAAGVWLNENLGPATPRIYVLDVMEKREEYFSTGSRGPSGYRQYVLVRSWREGENLKFKIEKDLYDKLSPAAVLAEIETQTGGLGYDYVSLKRFVDRPRTQRAPDAFPRLMTE
jgi:hypothetical protein